MNVSDLIDLLETLVQLPRETEWVEFKVNNGSPEDVGEYISALANSAALHRKELAYIVWGVEDETHKIVGTSFTPKSARIGNEELENWLARLLSPRVDFRVYQFVYRELPMALIEVVPCLHTPVRFRDTSWIRVGSYKKKLRDFPEKERALWSQLSGIPFEKGIALADVDDDGRHSQQGLRGRGEFRVRHLDVDAVCPGQHDRLRHICTSAQILKSIRIQSSIIT